MALLTRRAFAACLLVFVGSRAPIAGAPRTPTEYEVKAAFLCSFPDFIEWPANTNEAVIIGILGDDPFGSSLADIIRDRTRQSRALVIRHLTRVDGARDCQIVFVSESESARLGKIFGALEGASVLTVSDISDFALKGGVIGFTLEERRVRFQINVDAAERAGLRISSRLLRLAHIVGKAATGGAA